MDFYNFKSLALKIKNFQMNTKNSKVYWGSIKILTFVLSAPDQFNYQSDYDGEVFTCDLFHKSRQTTPTPWHPLLN